MRFTAGSGRTNHFARAQIANDTGVTSPTQRAGEHGVELTRVEILPVDANGVVDLAWLAAALGRPGGRALVAIHHANNESGVIQPIAEAAALDGVPRWFVFWRITLPMLTPFLLTATLFRVIESIQQFDIIYAMTQGGPGDTLTVFQVEAYLNFFQSTNVGRSAALLMILWAITYVLSNIFIKNWLRLREKQRGNA